MKVYIAGPMTGYVEHNFPAFHAAAARLRSLGYEVVSPAEMDEPLGLSHEELRQIPHEVFLRRDLVALLGCDGIYTLPGWRHSKGATLEVAVAKGCGILRVKDHDLDLWRTFEGEPEPEDAIDHAYCEPEQGDGQGNSWCGHGHEVEVADHDSAEDAEVLPFPGVDIVVDESLPPNTIRFETGTGSVDFEAQWPEEHRLVLVRKDEECDGSRGPECSEDDMSRGADEMLDRIARHSQPRHDSYQPGDKFPNVAYVRDMTGKTAAELAEFARQSFESEQFVRGTE